MRNIEQVNETLKKELSAAVSQLVEFPDGLITISWVTCAPNFSSAHIAISVIPDGLAGTALSKLKKANGPIAHVLKERLRFRQIPKLIWSFDPTEKNADSIENTFKKIEEGVEDEEDINYV